MVQAVPQEELAILQICHGCSTRGTRSNSEHVGMLQMRQNVDILRMNDPKRLPVVEMSDKETADNIRRLIMQPNSVDIGPSILVHYCWCSQRCGQQQDDRFQEWCDQRKERWTEKDYNGIGFSSCVLLEYAHSLDPQNAAERGHPDA